MMDFKRDEPCPGCEPDAPLELRIPCGNYLRAEVSVCVWCGKVTPRGDKPESIGSWCAGHMEAHESANPDAEWFQGWEPIEDVLPGGRLDGALEEIGLTTTRLRERPCAGGHEGQPHHWAIAGDEMICMLEKRS